MHRIFVNKKLSLSFILALSLVFSHVFENILYIIYYNYITVWFSARDLTGVQLWMYIVMYNTSMLKLWTKMYFTYCFCNIVVADDYYIFCYYYFKAVLETCICVPSRPCAVFNSWWQYFVHCTLYLYQIKLIFFIRILILSRSKCHWILLIKF